MKKITSCIKDERELKIVELLKKGEPVEMICFALNINANSISIIRKKYNLPSKKKTSIRLDHKPEYKNT